MQPADAVKALSALAQDTRLGVFRLLMEAGETGLAAGEIARRLDVAANTLSAHLQVLTNAGLADARRASRRIIYTVRLDTVRALLGFLVQDCCKGEVEVCRPLLDAVAPIEC